MILEEALILDQNILTTKGKEKAWDLPETYIHIMGDKRVSIAVTTDGLADAVQSIGGSKGFVKPLNEDMSLSDFLDRLSTSQLLLLEWCADDRRSRLGRDRVPTIARWEYLQVTA